MHQCNFCEFEAGGMFRKENLLYRDIFFVCFGHWEEDAFYAHPVARVVWGSPAFWCKRRTLSIKTSPLLQTTKTPDGLPRNRHWHNYQGSPPLCADRSRSAVTRWNRHPVLRRRTGDERTANARKGYRGPRGRRRWHSIGLPLAPSLAGSTACIYLNQQG